MKVSIITVCFNSAATIGDTMRSVVTQTHRDIEHIIVDGASKDDTLAISQATASRSPRVIREPDAGGIYDAMNKGPPLATGDFVAFLNADDMLADRHTIARIATAAMEREADAVYGDLSHVHRDRPGEVIQYWQSGEDLAAPKKNRVGGIATLLCKNARKVPQCFPGSRPGPSSTRSQ
jgi:glycosyltransferase